MSSSIWTQCAGDSELRALRLSPWRAVEAQHQVSTRKLVDTLEEHQMLEDLIEGSTAPGSARGTSAASGTGPRRIARCSRRSRTTVSSSSRERKPTSARW